MSFSYEQVDDVENDVGMILIDGLTPGIMVGKAAGFLLGTYVGTVDGETLGIKVGYFEGWSNRRF